MINPSSFGGFVYQSGSWASTSLLAPGTSDGPPGPVRGLSAQLKRIKVDKENIAIDVIFFILFS
jgi:hypothetical protein